MKTKTANTFLGEVIKDLCTYPSNIESCLFVFPTQSSIDYFQRLFNKSLSMPRSLTLHQLMLAHSTMMEMPNLMLLGELHELANQLFNSALPFEQFYAFGKILLEDLNCLDQHLIDVAEFFLTLWQQQQFTLPVTVQNFLCPNSLNADDLLVQEQSLMFWEKLPLLYQTFTQKLLQYGKGYSGLCYRIAAEKGIRAPFAQQMVVVGCNLLTSAEESFIIQCQSIMPVKFYWDIDLYYMDNPLNVAGYYLRQHKQKKHFQESFPIESVAYLEHSCKEVIVAEEYAVLAQIQSVIAVLQPTTGKPKCELEQTAIAISGTQLLMPLLDKLHRAKLPLRCRLHYPVGATLIFRLLSILVVLWKQHADGTNKEISYPLAGSVALFQQLVGSRMQAEIVAVLQDFSCQGVLDYLQHGLVFLDRYFSCDHTIFLDLNRAALQYILTYIASFREVAGTNWSASFFLDSLKESSFPFYQDKQGLSIVDVDEAHNLDFEHVFCINMSEGNFPLLTQNDSILPYNLRKQFGLPLIDKEAENITAYGFYRLLKRAKYFYCSYTKQSALGDVGEMSHLLLQLSFDSKLKISHQIGSLHCSVSSPPVISIVKDDKVMQEVSKFLVQEAQGRIIGLTPSLLTTYMSCPLQFYFAYVLQLKPIRQEQDDTMQLGIVFHYVMEKLYKPCIGKQLEASTIRCLSSQIQQVIEEAFTKHKQSNPLFMFELVKKILEAMLSLDKAATPFTVLGVEQKYQKKIALDNQRTVCLSGIIDRIDDKDHTIRIVDYKTGVSYDRITDIARLFDRKAIKKNKAMFQICLYTWLVTSVDLFDDQQAIMPYLINVRALFSNTYTPGISIQPLGTAYGSDARIVDLRKYLQSFEMGLRELLLEIFDSAIPFTQTEDRQICLYCPYNTICQRN